ncbi:MAG: M56 family metallopeptidase, partial [Oscillospiraceae bacterium]
MTNIWEFLVQTLTVSLVAALLLAVKELLADKLSPRWQYGVWSVLALRILLPVSMGRNVLLPVPLWVETWKAMAEKTLHSAYADIYTPLSIRWPIPWMEGAPQSLTDWLFAVYAAGVAGSLLWYLVSYLRLRRVLRRGSPVSEPVQASIQSVCARYALRPCRAVAVDGLPSAFVCGVLHPVLVLPADTETDEKVLLHELLHLKHHDALQSAVWCVLRSLHWCNPLMQLVFNRIGNDMESLCDQRVLEHLEGEERRDYGAILLSMANDRYPRAPGTTSVSNGGKNIARRIAAIVRFKKYPKGMGLVSVCVAVVLAVPVLAGTAASYSGELCRPNASSALDQAMAMTRIQRCTTLAGALDTYAKGLMYENGIYIAMASPLSRQDALESEMRYNAESDGWVAYHLDTVDELQYVMQNDGYRVYNLESQADGSYKALLIFSASAFLNPNGKGWWTDESGGAYAGSVAIPVSVWRENGWVVEERGKPMEFLGLSLYHILT